MKLINRAAECSIRNFISCKFNGTLEVLIIEGEPTLEELRNAFEEIETECNDLSGNRPAQLQLVNKINAMIFRNEAVKYTFFVIDEAVRRIPVVHDGVDLDMNKEILADFLTNQTIPRLKVNGISIKWKDDIDDFKLQVQNAKVREMLKEVQLEELNKELEQTKKLDTASPDYTIEDFYRELNAFEAHGYKISETETNMARLSIMKKDYIAILSKQGIN